MRVAKSVFAVVVGVANGSKYLDQSRVLWDGIDELGIVSQQKSIIRYIVRPVKHEVKREGVFSSYVIHEAQLGCGFLRHRAHIYQRSERSVLDNGLQVRLRPHGLKVQAAVSKLRSRGR